jgi:hypothetical protein
MTPFWGRRDWHMTDAERRSLARRARMTLRKAHLHTRADSLRVRPQASDKIEPPDDFRDLTRRLQKVPASRSTAAPFPSSDGWHCSRTNVHPAEHRISPTCGLGAIMGLGIATGGMMVDTLGETAIAKAEIRMRTSPWVGATDRNAPRRRPPRLPRSGHFVGARPATIACRARRWRRSCRMPGTADPSPGPCRRSNRWRRTMGGSSLPWSWFRTCCWCCRSWRGTRDR